MICAKSCDIFNSAYRGQVYRQWRRRQGLPYEKGYQFGISLDSYELGVDRSIQKRKLKAVWTVETQQDLEVIHGIR